MTTPVLRRLRAARMDQVALALIALQLLFRGMLVSRSWFVVDDYSFLADIARGEDDLAWYLRLHQGHFMPVSFLLVKAVAQATAPYDWTGAAVQILLLQALASLACWWMLRTLFGPGRAALVGLALYLSTALTMPALMWWAVAINQLPHQVAFFGAITAHVLFARTRRARWVLVATLFLALGYTTYAKTGLIVITLAMLTLIWLVQGPPWQRFWSAIGRFWFAWLCYGLVSVAWLVMYVSRPERTVSETPTQFLPLLQAELFESLLPTLVGGPFSWSPFGDGPIQFVAPSVPLVVLSTVVVVLVVLVAWLRTERSLLVLWLLGVYLMLSAVLVYSGRSYSIGLIGGGTLGRNVQYLSDAAPLLVLAAVALFRPVLGVADPVRPRIEPLLRRGPGSLAVGALVALVAVSGTVSAIRYASLYEDFPERDVNQRAIASIEALGGDAVLADTLVPETAVSPLLGDRALVRNYYAPIGDSYTVSQAGVGLLVLDQDGDLVRANVGPVPDLPPARAADGCVAVGRDGDAIELDPPASLGLWLALDYRSRSDTPISISGVGTSWVVDAPAGTNRILVAAPRPGDTVELRTWRDAGFCVTRAEYGLVGPS